MARLRSPAGRRRRWLPGNRRRGVWEEELLDYLRRRGEYGEAAEPLPYPDLILLDLKMPQKDGFEVLAELKNDPMLRRIPVVVLPSSATEDDVARSYDLGVNSFVTKPHSFTARVRLMGALTTYWLDTVDLPGKHA